jgi:hypothetical protein
MTDNTPDPRAIASIFDLRRSASRQDLLHLVGDENFPRFETAGKPLVVVFSEGGPAGKSARFAFEDDDKVLDFYRTILRRGDGLPAHERTRVVPRHLSPELHAALLRAQGG